MRVPLLGTLEGEASWSANVENDPWPRIGAVEWPWWSLCWQCQHQIDHMIYPQMDIICECQQTPVGYNSCWQCRHDNTSGIAWTEPQSNLRNQFFFIFLFCIYVLLLSLAVRYMKLSVRRRCLPGLAVNSLNKVQNFPADFATVAVWVTAEFVILQRIFVPDGFHLLISIQM